MHPLLFHLMKHCKDAAMAQIVKWWFTKIMIPSNLYKGILMLCWCNEVLENIVHGWLKQENMVFIAKFRSVFRLKRKRVQRKECYLSQRSRSYYRVLHKHRTSNQSPWLPKTLVMWSPCANWWAPHQQISILLWFASTAAKEVSLHKSMSRRHHDIVLRKYQLMLIHLAIVDNMFVLRLYQSPRIKRGCKLVLDRTIPRLKSEWADMHHSFHNQWVYFNNKDSIPVHSSKVDTLNYWKERSTALHSLC